MQPDPSRGADRESTRPTADKLTVTTIADYLTSVRSVNRCPRCQDVVVLPLDTAPNLRRIRHRPWCRWAEPVRPLLADALAA